MLERLRHMFRKHLRSALLIALGAAALTFSGTLFASVLFGNIDRTDRESAEAAMVLRQRMLESRIDRVEAENARARNALARLGQDITASEELLETVPTAESAVRRGVFPINDVIGAIVELVCIDNDDDDVYYTATGTIVDARGLILTNSHILNSGDGSVIRFCGVGLTTDISTPPVIEYIAKTTAVHHEVDLALLEITEHLSGEPLPEAFTSVRVSEANTPFIAPELGELVFIGGYPGIGADTFTFTQGVVSGHVGASLIKTSALIDSGSSGGAAFDENGRYIGVATAAVPGDIGGSLGYLISLSAVDMFLADYYEGIDGVDEDIL